MSSDLREIFKKSGITQQELADYLGISRQYLNSYLDETYETPLMPGKYMDNILFLFECSNRAELFAEDFNRNPKNIRKRMNIVRSTKDSLDNLFNIEPEKKLELFKIVESFQPLSQLDRDMLESFGLLMDYIVKDDAYRAILSFIGKKNLIIDIDDERFNSDLNKIREVLLFEAFENKNLNFAEYKDKYEAFVSSIKKPNDIDLDVLKQSLAEMGYTNISQKEVLDLLNKYYEIKNNENKKE